jgi:hypothetical protein
LRLGGSIFIKYALDRSYTSYGCDVGYRQLNRGCVKG